LAEDARAVCSAIFAHALAESAETVKKRLETINSIEACVQKSQRAIESTRLRLEKTIAQVRGLSTTA